MRFIWIPLTLGLACSGQAVDDEPAPTTTADAGNETTEESAPANLSAEEMASNQQFDVTEHLLTPSPQEMHAALARADGLTMPMPADHDYSGSVEHRDHLAVQTGVLLADLVLTSDTASPEWRTFTSLKVSPAISPFAQTKRKKPGIIW